MNYWPGYHDSLPDVIVFGGVPDELAVLDTHTFPHSRVVDQHQWALGLNEVKFGKFHKKLEGMNSYVVFNSTTTHLTVFKELWQVLVDEFVSHGFTCSKTECFKKGECVGYTGAFDNIQITVEDHSFVMPFHSWANSADGENCRLTVKPQEASKNYMELGNSFMITFPPTFDFE